jgi:hypothetical protein
MWASPIAPARKAERCSRGGELIRLEGRNDVALSAPVEQVAIAVGTEQVSRGMHLLEIKDPRPCSLTNFLRSSWLSKFAWSWPAARRQAFR